MSVDGTIESFKGHRLAGWLDWLQMLSGLSLAVFLFAHMLFIGSVIFGASALDFVAEFFEKTYLAQVGGPLLFLLFLLHGFLGARKMPFRTKEQKLILRHAKMMHHRDTWFWVVQAVTGAILLVIASIHMWSVLSDLPITAAKSAENLRNSLWLIFYLILIFVAAFHACIGLYRIGVKWGFVTRATRAKALKVIYYLIGIYVGVELINLIRFYFLKV
jgi:fumarate reductase subunit C